MVSSQNQVKICHAKPPGYQLLMRLLQLVLQLAQGMLYIEWFDLYLHLHHLFGGQYLQTLLLHD